MIKNLFMIPDIWQRVCPCWSGRGSRRSTELLSCFELFLWEKHPQENQRLFPKADGDMRETCMIQLDLRREEFSTHYGNWKGRSSFFFKFLKDFIYLYLERREGREKERERDSNVWLPLTCAPPGSRPVTQACALTRNWTGDLLVHNPCSIRWATPARAEGGEV